MLYSHCNAARSCAAVSCDKMQTCCNLWQHTVLDRMSLYSIKFYTHKIVESKQNKGTVGCTETHITLLPTARLTPARMDSCCTLNRYSLVCSNCRGSVNRPLNFLITFFWVASTFSSTGAYSHFLT